MNLFRCPFSNFKFSKSNKYVTMLNIICVRRKIHGGKGFTIKENNR